MARSRKPCSRRRRKRLLNRCTNWSRRKPPSWCCCTSVWKRQKVSARDSHLQQGCFSANVPDLKATESTKSTEGDWIHTLCELCVLCGLFKWGRLRRAIPTATRGRG